MPSQTERRQFKTGVGVRDKFQTNDSAIRHLTDFTTTTPFPHNATQPHITIPPVNPTLVGWRQTGTGDRAGLVEPITPPETVEVVWLPVDYPGLFGLPDRKTLCQAVYAPLPYFPDTYLPPPATLPPFCLTLLPQWVVVWFPFSWTQTHPAPSPCPVPFAQPHATQPRPPVVPITYLPGGCQPLPCYCAPLLVLNLPRTSSLCEFLPPLLRGQFSSLFVGLGNK